MHPLAKLDHKYVWHPFTQMRDWLKTEPIIIAKGRGAMLEDVRGRKYLDANSSIWTNLHGHAHPRINSAIQKQLGKIKGFRAEHGAYSIELSGKLSTAKVEVFQDLITIDAQGSYEAETAFFEVLRKCESSFLALDLEHQRYGWLKPIKERKFV